MQVLLTFSDTRHLVQIELFEIGQGRRFRPFKPSLTWQREQAAETRLLLEQEIATVGGIEEIQFNSTNRRINLYRTPTGSWPGILGKVLVILRDCFAPGQPLNRAIMPCKPRYFGPALTRNDFQPLPAPPPQMPIQPPRRTRPSIWL
jgi:hypothetical protein